MAQFAQSFAGPAGCRVRLIFSEGPDEPDEGQQVSGCLFLLRTDLRLLRNPLKEACGFRRRSRLFVKDREEGEGGEAHEQKIALSSGQLSRSCVEIVVGQSLSQATQIEVPSLLLLRGSASDLRHHLLLRPAVRSGQRKEDRFLWVALDLLEPPPERLHDAGGALFL